MGMPTPIYRVKCQNISPNRQTQISEEEEQEETNNNTKKKQKTMKLKNHYKFTSSPVPQA